MALRTGEVRAGPAPKSSGRRLLLAGDGTSRSGTDAAVISFPDIRARNAARLTPQWVESALFDDSAARILIGPSSELLWASPIGEELIDRSECFRMHNGRLAGVTARIHAKLDLLIADARQGRSTEELFAADGSDHRAIFVGARPTPGPKLGTVALVLREAGRESTAMPDLKRLFGLTATESHVVRLLLNGLSVAEIAARENNSGLTVRTHLKRSYAKMNIRTKEQLFAKVLRLLTD